MWSCTNCCRRIKTALGMRRFYLMIASHPMTVYKRPKGYIANALLFSGTAPPTNGTLAHDAHMTANGMTIHLTMGFRTNRNRIAATFKGNKQYPNRHRDWKNPIVPPKRTTLTVSTRAPMDSNPNTSCNNNTSIVVDYGIISFYSFIESQQQQQQQQHK